MKGILFYLALFLLIFIYSVSANAFDYDLWARLIAGMGVIDGGHVLTQDFLSYTPVHTWWDHEWGAGVIFYAFLKYFGAYSLIILQALMFFGIFFTASKVIKLRTEETPYNILFYFFAFMSLVTNLNQPIRCHMFSFLLFTVFVYILERVRKGSNKLLFLIPVIILFWNNIHGGVVSGLGLLFMYAVGEFLNKKPFKKYLITLLISCAVMFINPWGFDYIKFLLMANTMPRPDIVEWWGIFSPFHMFRHLEFKALFLTLLCAEGIYLFKQIKTFGKEFYQKADKTKYIIILATAYLAITHVKLMPFFTISALCFIYEDFYELIKNIKFPAFKDKLVYALIFLSAIFTFATKDLKIPVGMERYPIKEVEFVKQNNLKGKILVNFGYGSYVSYKLYPNNLIYMDGRYEEVYPDYMVPIIKQFFLVTPTWKTVFEYFPPDIMIIENTYPVYEVLKKSKEWKVVYEGENFGVFLPSKLADKNFVQPTNDINYYRNNLFTTDIKF